MRRSGFATKAEASAALTNVLQCERAGVGIDDTETVADYLHRWFEAKAPTRKPNTVNRYRAYLDNDLIPAFGAIRLERLTHEHVAQFIRRELDADRGLVTLRRCIATLSTALNDARRAHRLDHNAARYAQIPRRPARSSPAATRFSPGTTTNTAPASACTPQPRSTTATPTR